MNINNKFFVEEDSSYHIVNKFALLMILKNFGVRRFKQLHLQEHWSAWVLTIEYF